MEPAGEGEGLPPDCPRCGRELVRERNDFGPRRKPQEWRRCPGCGWLGRPDLGGRPVLHPFRRVTGEFADCLFCGGENSNLAGERFLDDGWLCAWLVCEACGRENVLRVERATG